MNTEQQIKRLKERKEEEVNIFLGKMAAINDEIKFWRREAKRHKTVIDKQKQTNKPIREKDYWKQRA